MANNELDEILAEIRRKAQENETAQKAAEAEALPVDVVEEPVPRPASGREESADDIFGDILRAVSLSEAKKEETPLPEEQSEQHAVPEPPKPEEEPLRITLTPDEPAEPQEAPAPEKPSIPESPESMFTIVEDAPEGKTEVLDRDGAPDDVLVAKEESVVLPDGKAFDTAAFGLITGGRQEEEPEESEEKTVAVSSVPAEEVPAEDEPAEDEPAEDEPKKNGKKILAIVLACFIIIAALVGVYFGFFHNKEQEEPTETKPAVTEAATVAPVTEKTGGILNPLTGEPGYNEAAVGKRPVAVVVENEYSTSAIRPQWGIEEADIVMEAETEFSTRMLFFWADYTALPDEIGPTRSARPPFIRFSQLFDSVFIHAGLSHSKGNYVGADSVFENENIDHINLLSLEENGTYFGRDKSRTSTIEHTGYLNGANAAQLIEKQGFRTDADANRFTQFEFNEKAAATGNQDAKTVRFTWSDRCPKNAKFTYIDSEGIYRTSDFDAVGREADLQFETILLLLDETEYIVKENYKGSQSETYCDYHLAGGKALLATEGKAQEITWDVENNKLVLKDEKGETVKLNPGKIYIGYGSSNHGGSYAAEGANTDSAASDSDDNN